MPNEAPAATFHSGDRRRTRRPPPRNCVIGDGRHTPQSTVTLRVAISWPVGARNSLHLSAPSLHRHCPNAQVLLVLDFLRAPGRRRRTLACGGHGVKCPRALTARRMQALASMSSLYQELRRASCSPLPSGHSRLRVPAQAGASSSSPSPVPRCRGTAGRCGRRRQDASGRAGTRVAWCCPCRRGVDRRGVAAELGLVVERVGDLVGHGDDANLDGGVLLLFVGSSTSWPSSTSSLILPMKVISCWKEMLAASSLRRSRMVSMRVGSPRYRMGLIRIAQISAGGLPSARRRGRRRAGPGRAG